MRQAAYAGMCLKHVCGMTDKGMRIFADLMCTVGFVPKPSCVPRCALWPVKTSVITQEEAHA